MLRFSRFLPIFVVLVVALFLIATPIQKLNLQPVQPVVATTSDYNVADVVNSHGDFDSNAVNAVFNNQAVNYPKDTLSQGLSSDEDTAVLGDSTDTNSSDKWIDVSISKQQVTAYEGTKIVRQFLISSGRWAPTPIGTFHIWYKTKFQRMVGGDKALGDYYNLPNVPNNMFFDQGFALHGAYWHNNFGQPMSHGCVNEPLADAAWMFDWAGPKVPDGQNWVKATDDNPGTKVVIHE